MCRNCVEQNQLTVELLYRILEGRTHDKFPLMTNPYTAKKMAHRGLIYAKAELTSFFKPLCFLFAVSLRYIILEVSGGKHSEVTRYNVNFRWGSIIPLIVSVWTEYQIILLRYTNQIAKNKYRDIFVYLDPKYQCAASFACKQFVGVVWTFKY